MITSGISVPHATHCHAHSHDCWEIVICMNGQCTLVVEDTAIDFVPGTIVCQPPNAVHYVPPSPGYQDLWIKLDHFTSPVLASVPVFHDSDGRFLWLAKMLHETIVGHSANRDQLILSLWTVLYQLLCNWASNESNSAPVTTLLRDMTLKLSDPDYCPAVTISQSGYSPDYVRRCFKKEMGTTPTEYLMKLRIESAQRLLSLPSRGGYSIKQIANLCGFSDPYYFSRSFRKHVGLSPKEYR